MKTIGVLGGMSWESTQAYYRALNEGVNARLGGLHSARIILNSVDFHEIEQCQQSGQWDRTADILIDAARSLEAAGADFLLLATNTMHKVAPQLQAASDLPLIHIADCTAERLCEDGIRRVGLLGTRFTMSEAFYRERMQSHFGLDVLVPDAADQNEIHRVIYEELCLGKLVDSSREHYLAAIDRLHARGAEAVILGCTEIGLLVSQQDTTVPLFDTTALHAQKAVELALETK